MIQYLYKEGIETRSFFAPINEQPAYKFLDNHDKFKNSLHLAGCGISLPSAASLSSSDQEFIINKMNNFIKTHITNKKEKKKKNKLKKKRKNKIKSLRKKRK
jgi:dTDP-4-amino-4,6-dideoxygalactose transaminase